MDRATDPIRVHIDREREVIDRERELLRSNLEELEARVRSVVDWRRHYRGNPAIWIGVAFGSGLLLALASARGPAAPQRPEYPRGGEPLAGYSDHRRREISRAWRTIESALIGVAAARLKDALIRVLPGFEEHLPRREGDGYAHDPSARNRSQH